MTHSPAPWRAIMPEELPPELKEHLTIEDLTQMHGCLLIVDANYSQVAQICVTLEDEISPDRQAMADACLIPEAPTLLSAVKALRDYYDADKYKDHKSHPWYRVLQSIARADQ